MNETCHHAMIHRRTLLAGGLSLSFPAKSQARGGRSLTVAVTHTVDDSGVLVVLGRAFLADSGIVVRFVVFGSGQALDVARRGDVDVVLSHLKPEEERFVAEGHGVERRPVMYNDFILVGPRTDPAGVAGLRDVSSALTRIRAREAPFVSRGDLSGTHAAERALWLRASIDIDAARGRWYRQIGQGMGATLNMAAALPGYALTDRGSWLAFRNRGDLVALVEGDSALRNQYAVIQVDPRRHRHVRAREGEAFVRWLTGPEGQRAIDGFRVGGEVLFFSNAGEPGA
jgi:tungstate transport system substrate-binding protein